MKRFVVLVGLCTLLGACFLRSEGQASPQVPTQQLPPTPTAIPLLSETEWGAVAEGLEQRRYISETGAVFIAVRIDPILYTFRAHYRPNEAYSLAEWQEALPSALAIINANFFTPEHEVLGLLISDWGVYGRAYGRGGTFVVQNGVPRVRSTAYEPYWQGEPLEQAVQAFPMLVLNGEAIYDNPRDVFPSRRTVIGQDTQGRILFFVTPSFGMGLSPLSQYLADLDAELVNAFNLDGGGSSMLALSPANIYMNSFDPVPAVLAVYAR